MTKKEATLLPLTLKNTMIMKHILTQTTYPTQLPSLQHPLQDLGIEYFLVDTKTHHHNVKETHPIQQPTPHITPEITQLLVDLFNIVHSYYSSPLTCPYNLPHIWDILFGSMGHAQISKQTTSMLAHPTNYNTTLEAIHWVGMEAKEDSNATTILIIYR
jgi:hypothetical protein